MKTSNLWLWIRWFWFHMSQNLQRALWRLFVVCTSFIFLAFPQRGRPLAKLDALCDLLLFRGGADGEPGTEAESGDSSASLTCRLRTLSETFSWDMLWSRCCSFAESSGIKTLSCERARDPMGFNCLRKKSSGAVSFIHSVKTAYSSRATTLL